MPNVNLLNSPLNASNNKLNIQRKHDQTEQLRALLSERILILDGAMGTMIQDHNFTEEDYRGERFADWGQDVKGNNDLLSLTQPNVIRQIHEDFFTMGLTLLRLILSVLPLSHKLTTGWKNWFMKLILQALF